MIKWLKEKFRKTPKKWFTSDLHFSHKNVIPYCNRPFKTIEEMNAHIIKVWNKTVKPFDIVYVLGDFSLNPKWSRLIVPQLNGYKVLIAGNHDSCHISHKKSEKFVKKYLEEWNEVYSHSHYVELRRGTQLSDYQYLYLMLSHLPYDNEFDNRYKDYKLTNIGQLLLHGHLHGRYKKNKRQIDVGWDAHNGKLLSEDDVIELINDKREFIPSHLTEFYKNRKDDRNDAS